MSEWTVAPVALKVAYKGDVIEQVVAGWVKGPLALDFRVFDDSDGDWTLQGFVLTHLPTGMIVRQIIGGFEVAVAAADKIIAVMDWETDDVEVIQRQAGPAIKALMATNTEIVTGHRALGPLL